MQISSRPKTAAIVPAYNEEETVGEIVRVLVASPLLDEVIVVSDGSTDRTAEIARENGADIVDELPKSGGKGAAMLRGLIHTDAPLIIFFDADLRGLTPDHVERLLLPVVSGARAMNVGLRDRGRFFTALSRRLPLIGGERALKREIVEKIPPEFMQGFMIESALNYYCRSRGLRYGAVNLPGLGIRRKYEKVGMKKAAGQYIRMFVQIFEAMLAVRLARMLGRF